MTGFLSDNVARAHPAIMDAVVAANTGAAASYGDDAYSKQLDAVFSEVFERDVVVIPCVSGTAANALALSLVAGPTRAICAHVHSHVSADEVTAPEFFTGGARLVTVGGDDGKLDVSALEPTVSRTDVHAARPAAVTITQASELGTVYTLDELAEIGAFTRKHGLALHMDGARFANALVTCGCRPAQMTWELGVDLMSFGATKNGCMTVDAIVLFDTDLADEARVRAKRAGQLLSKMRFQSAQLVAYLDNDLWLANARHANRMAQQLHAEVSRHPELVCERAPDANMVFINATDEAIATLDQAGVAYAIEASRIRLCTAWCTSPADVEQLLPAPAR